jgi:hypothetical protein
LSRLRNPLNPRLLGVTAVAFSALYLLSDVIEAIQRGLSDGQRLRLCGLQLVNNDLAMKLLKRGRALLE